MEVKRKLVKFANWKARRVVGKREKVESLLIQNLDVLCISESWLTREQTFKINGYITYRCDRVIGRGGPSLILMKVDG